MRVFVCLSEDYNGASPCAVFSTRAAADAYLVSHETVNSIEAYDVDAALPPSPEPRPLDTATPAAVSSGSARRAEVGETDAGSGTAGAEPRCDLHGPYTPEQAAALVLGWQPPQTGHLCEQCRADVTVAAQALADRIDADIAEKVHLSTLHG